MKQQKSILLVIDRLDYETGSSLRHAIQRHSGGGKCLRPFFHGQIVSRDDKRRGIAARIVMSMQEARIILPRVRCINIVEKKSSKFFILLNQPFRPTLSTNPFDQPFRPAFSTNLFDGPSRSTFSTNLLDQQNAFHSRDCRRSFSLGDDERHQGVLQSWPVRHRPLRANVMSL